MINKIIHSCLQIWNCSSCVQLDISLVCCTHSRAIKWHTLREIPHLRAPMYYSLFNQNKHNNKISTWISVVKWELNSQLSTQVTTSHTYWFNKWIGGHELNTYKLAINGKAGETYGWWLSCKANTIKLHLHPVTYNCN